MKQLKKAMAVIFAVVLALSMTVTASAETKEGTITLTTSNTNNLSGTFKAYRLLDYVYADSSSSEFSYSINSSFIDFFKTELQKTEEETVTPEEAYDYLVREKADDLRNSIMTWVTEDTEGIDGVVSGNTVKFEQALHGYYVIVPENEAYACNVLSFTGGDDEEPDGYIKIKEPVPDKTSNDKKKVSSEVGSIVEFKVKSVVPDITAQTENYYFIMQDTMSTGLTYYTDADKKLSVKIAGTELQEDDYEVTGNVGSNTLTVKIPLLEKNTEDGYKIDYRQDIGSDIEITYYALVGKDAIVDTDDAAAKNEAKISYGNSPEFDGTGNTKPSTPSVVTVYNHDLTIKNTDLADNPITGGKFEILYPNGDKVSLIEENGYYRPTLSGESGITEIKMDNESGIVIKGLGAGEYTVQQTTPPSGYLKPDDNNLTYTFEDGNSNPGEVIFKNAKDTGLPETGGMGTVIFTVVGLALIAAVAGSFIISRKKKNS